jgi:hypothetical protein
MAVFTLTEGAVTKIATSTTNKILRNLTRDVKFFVTDSVVDIQLQNPTRFPETTDLMITTNGEAGAVASATARGWLELN